VEELWDEWSSFPIASEEAASAEAAGIIAGLRPGKLRPGSLRSGKAAGAKNFCDFGSSRLWVLHRLLRLWKNSRWAERLNLAGRMLVPESMKGRVRITLPKELHEEITQFAPPGWEWVRGVWGSCGSLYMPKSGYYLVLRSTEENVIVRVGKILQKARIPRTERMLRGAWVIILRDQEEIVTFLSKIGLTGISLSVEDKAILRSMRDRANRMRNCDTANIRKSLRTAEEQMKLALKLQSDNLLDTLSPSFRSLVEARLKHPEASLSELGSALSPSVTKSTIKYRWKRLCEFMGEPDGLA
jgi:DNA-binding protein WhiA